MKRKLLCFGPFCHPDRIKHDREKMYCHKRKHYCPKCWKYIKEQRSGRKDLYDYIKRQAHVHYPTAIMRKDIKQFKDEYDYSYRGMKTALIYANKHSIKFDFHGQFFMRYVPYCYEDAQRWQFNREHHDNLMLNHDEAPENQITHATVNPKVFEPKKTIPHYDLSKF